jgi:hypothetical protein
MTDMSEQEKIETRCLAVFPLSLRASHLHVMTTTQQSANNHFTYFRRIAEQMGVEVVLLPTGATAASYLAKVLVGPIAEFIANWDRGLAADDAIAMVEGEPPSTARSMLACYQSVRLS